MTTAAEKFFHQVFPPRAAGKQAVQSVATSAAAAATALWTGLGANAPKGRVFLAFEALTQDCYIRLRTDNVAGVTTSTGMLIKAGQPATTFWVNPSVDVYVDHIGAGVGVLKWYASSPEDGGNG